jgi:AcrR family transcriptional regulator
VSAAGRDASSSVTTLDMRDQGSGPLPPAVPPRAHFPTKQSVLEAAAVDLLDRTMARLHDDVEDEARPVTERLEELVRSFATHFAGDREFAGLLALNTQLWLLRRHRQETYGLLTRLLDEGQRRDVHRSRPGHDQQLVACPGR